MERRVLAIIMVVAFITMFGVLMYVSNMEPSDFATMTDLGVKTEIATELDIDPDIGVQIVIVNPWKVMYHYGDMITLACRVKGIAGDYEIEWEYTPDAENEPFVSLENYGEYYTFILTPENEDYEYRTVIRY